MSTLLKNLRLFVAYLPLIIGSLLAMLGRREQPGRADDQRTGLRGQVSWLLWAVFYGLFALLLPAANAGPGERVAYLSLYVFVTSLAVASIRGSWLPLGQGFGRQISIAIGSVFYRPKGERLGWLRTLLLVFTYLLPLVAELWSYPDHSEDLLALRFGLCFTLWASLASVWLATRGIPQRPTA